MRWKRKSTFIMAISIGIAVVVWGQMGMYLANLFFGADVKVNFFKFCVSLFREKSLYYFLVITFLNALIAYALLIVCLKIYQQFVHSKRFKQRLMSLRNIDLTAHVIQMYKPLNQHIIVIDHEQAMAFTVGVRRPMVVLSSGLIDLLDEQELEAVIAHEAFHQSHYDSLKIFILQLISQSLWFIPLTRWSYHNYKLISELLADESAIRQTGSELGLGGALLKLIKKGFSDHPTPVLVYFSDGVVNYRLQQLIDPNEAIPVRLNMTTIVISIPVMLLFMGMIALAIT
ncbi:M56 family metallopeptidase [Paenibacillus sinopodophylli]|uniref:M56 family metallopeptidase n=1 Tax=Paenibacillus sinopodophylli TaxID=1837342 RepID=UPI00110CA12C|nr:M56 family metallopeptidase [Paenibacillus sinopodophylli]